MADRSFWQNELTTVCFLGSKAYVQDDTITRSDMILISPGYDTVQIEQKEKENVLEYTHIGLPELM